MAKKFADLRKKMTPAAQARAAAETKEILLAEALIACIPTTWLDPLLSGDTSIKVPAGCPDIEKLLNGIRARMRDTLTKGTR